MGASNVAAVYQNWSHVDNAPFRLLIYMALVTLDEPNGTVAPRRYFGGREALAAALGYQVPAGDDPGARLQRGRAYRNVKKAVGVLFRVGAIERAQRPMPGRQAEYLLRLNGSTSGDPVGKNGSTSGVGMGLPEVPNGSTSGDQMGTPEVAPKENRGERGTTEEHTLGLAADLPTAPGEQAERASDPPTRPSRPPPKPAPAGYTDAFDTAWTAYGRKGAKKAAFAEWQKAITRADVAAVTAAIGPYVESTPEFRYRKDFERWLKGDGWESAIVPREPAANGAYRPSTTDQRVMQAQALKALYADDPSNQRKITGGDP